MLEELRGPYLLPAAPDTCLACAKSRASSVTMAMCGTLLMDGEDGVDDDSADNYDKGNV